MILTGNEIKKQVRKGNIFIDPFEPKNINPNSYNYRLGDYYMDLETNKPIPVPQQGLILKPKNLYLFSTFESIGSNTFTISLIGRSSIGRLGIFLNVDADLGHIGTNHKWTLEVMAIQSAVIYPRMKIGQVSFWVPQGDLTPYQGKYTEFNKPKKSIYKPENL